MNPPYLSELKVQIEVIDQRLQELQDKAYHGALSPRYLSVDMPEAKRLIARRKEIERKIINYEPPSK